MSKDFTPGQKKIVDRYYEHHDTIQVTKLSELVTELWLAEDEKSKVKMWGKVQIALMRLNVNAVQVAAIVGKRDLQGLAALVQQVNGGATAAMPTQQEGEPRVKSVADGRTIAQMKAERAAAEGYDSLEEENLKRALRAFRRKLKALRRDDESKLGSRYVTYGKTSDIAAIEPPHEYPRKVWTKLVELKRLKDAGSGTYQLPD